VGSPKSPGATAPLLTHFHVILSLAGIVPLPSLITPFGDKAGWHPVVGAGLQAGGRGVVVVVVDGLVVVVVVMPGGSVNCDMKLHARCGTFTLSLLSYRM